MSSFDEAFRNQAAQQQSRNTQQQREHAKRRQTAEAAALIVARLVREFLRKVLSERVPPQQARMGHLWSPAGYVLSVAGSPSVRISWAGLAVVTPSGDLFISSGERSGFIPITPESILNGDLRWLQNLDIDENGQVLADTGFDRPCWEPFETLLASSLATAALALVEGVGGQLPADSNRRVAVPKTRTDVKLESLKAEIDSVRRTLKEEEARNRSPRKISNLRIKLYRLDKKYDKLAQRNQ